MTDPGWSFYNPDFRMFDAGPEDRQGVLSRLSKALNRKCDETCQVGWWFVLVACTQRLAVYR